MPTTQPSITTWSRLEPSCRRDDISEGLRATINDPLWLLTRQWQMGEFFGEDAGSPATTTVSAAACPIDAVQRGAQSEPVHTAGMPLEALVEREQVRGDDEWVRLTTEAGAYFLRLLEAHGAATLRTAYIAAFPLPPLPSAPAGAPADPAAARLHRLATGRLPDGGALYASLHSALGQNATAANLPAQPAVPAALVAGVLAAAVAFMDWYEHGLADESAGTAPPYWDPGRLDYDFAVSAATTAGTLSLSAPDFAAAHIDWYSFDIAALPAPPDPVQTEVQPSRVQFRGVSADRFWEVEDPDFDLGAVEGGPEDLTRMLLVEFALVYGQDWYIAPLEVPVGAVTRVLGLSVVDTFGRTTVLRHYSEIDRPGGGWHMFAHSAPAGSQPGSLLYAAPTVVGDLRGEAIETVHLLRDEMATMAWAIERTVVGSSGRPINSASGLDTPPGAPAGPATETLEFVLESAVPNAWLPLLPQTDPGSNVFHMLTLGHVAGQGAAAYGRILAPRPLAINEEQVPREGVAVTRNYRFARWSDGSSHLWLSRTREVGPGAAASGLLFDQLSPDNEV